MARPKSAQQLSEPPQLNQGRIAEDMETSSRLAAIETAAEKAQLETSVAFMQIGQIQMASSFRDLARGAIINILDELVKSGKHIGLKYRKQDGSIGTTEDIREFCDVFLGRDYTVIAEDRKNLRLVGAKVYDELESRLGRAEWRALRNLEKVDDARVANALSAPEEDRASRILVLIDQVIAERDEEAKKRKESEADLAAARATSRKHKDHIEELEHKLERYHRGAVPAPEMVEPIVIDLHKIGRATELHIGSLDGLLSVLDRCATDEFDKPDESRNEGAIITAIQRMQEQLFRLGRKLGGVQARFELCLEPLLSGRDLDLLRTGAGAETGDSEAGEDKPLRAVK